MQMRELFKILGYPFSRPEWLNMALTHRSFKVDDNNHNERLEFLGDAILNFIIADALYQQFPHAPEGDLSRLRASLVNEKTLAEIAQEFKLGEYLQLGPGELKSGGAHRKSILADALEAIIGAIYFDANKDMAICQKIVLRWFAARLKKATPIANPKDAKSLLQEFLQAQKLHLPVYNVLAITGEAHAQHFHVSCEVSGFDFRTEGKAVTRRSAEQIAAEHFYRWLQKHDQHDKYE